LPPPAYRYSIGWPVRYPRNNLEYVTRFLHMMFEVPSEPLELSPVAAKALDLLFILHADHEQNASTSTVRLVGSTGANPYACVAAGIAALWGPAHGGANEAVLKMLTEIGDAGRCCVRGGQGQGQGLRFPPDGLRPSRLQELRSARDHHPRDDPQGAGRPQRQRPLLEVAMALEEVALKDSYFVQRKLYPNVDFYSGIIYKALKIPTEMFTVMFAIARTAGWVAHWLEQQGAADGKIGRPRQVYTGAAERNYVAMDKR
jgi:citrate synthase